LSGGAVLKAATVSISGNYSLTNGASLVVSGTTTTGAPAMADPYASVAVPTPGACAATNSWGGATVATISPGTYCNGMTFSNGAVITMNPGVYIVDRGVFHVTGGANVNATSGVTIVLTSSSGSNYATALFDNGITFNITAPTTGTTKGLALFQDRRAEATNSESFGGGSTTNITGALYFPAQTVNYANGATTTSTCTQLIAYRVIFSGGSKFMDGCSAVGTTEIGYTASTLVE
jgi:hypothetical protein